MLNSYCKPRTNYLIYSHRFYTVIYYFVFLFATYLFLFHWNFWLYLLSTSYSTEYRILSQTNTNQWVFRWKLVLRGFEVMISPVDWTYVILINFLVNFCAFLDEYWIYFLWFWKLNKVEIKFHIILLNWSFFSFEDCFLAEMIAKI